MHVNLGYIEYKYAIWFDLPKYNGNWNICPVAYLHAGHISQTSMHGTNRQPKLF